jgi:hypothetical protein
MGLWPSGCPIRAGRCVSRFGAGQKLEGFPNGPCLLFTIILMHNTCMATTAEVGPASRHEILLESRWLNVVDFQIKPLYHGCTGFNAGLIAGSM